MILEIDQAVGRTIGWELAERPATRHGRPLPYLLPRCRNPNYCHGRWKPLSHYPSFSADLNAMNRAIDQAIVISNSGHGDFSFLRYGDEMIKRCGSHGAIVADAKVRAEVYLRVLGLWDETYRL